MSAELVERLRGHAEIMARDKGTFVRFIDAADCTEAVAVIEAQAAEIERLRGANNAAAECVAAMMQECARYRDEIRAALESKP